MPLFDYTPPAKYTPYFSDPTNDPRYIELMKDYKKQSAIGSVIGGVFGLAGTAADIFGGMGLGKKIGGGIGDFINNGINKSFENSFKALKQPLPQVTTTGALSESKDGLSPLESLGKSLLNSRTSALKFSFPTNGDTNYTAPQMGGTEISTTPTEGQMDWGSSFNDTGNQFSAPTVGLKKGGKIIVSDAGIKFGYAKGGKANVDGADNIALINTDTGEDTGVRVSEGEMLVVSKPNLEALNKAISKGDHKGVFNIIKKQVEQSPKVKDGTTGFAGGGIKPKEGAIVKDSDGYDLIYKNGKWVYKEGQLFRTGEAEDQELANVQYGEQERLKSLREGKIENPYTPTIKSDAYSTGVAEKKPKLDSKRIEPEKQIDNKEESVDNSEVQLPKFKTSDYMGEEPIVEESAAPSADILGLGDTTPTPPSYVDITQYSSPTITPQKSFDWSGALGDVLGTGFDIGRGILGWQAANTPVPKWQKPPQWNDFMNRLRTQSYEGLSAPELTRLQTDADRTYAYDVANIYNLSGGNAGMALGNLGRAAANKYANELNIAGLNRQALNRNLMQYGAYLPTDVSYDRQIFGDAYNQAMATKTSGAQLVNDAISNIRNRFDYNKQYGLGRDYSNLLGLEKSNLEDENDILKAQKEHYSKLYNR